MALGHDLSANVFEFVHFCGHLFTIQSLASHSLIQSNLARNALAVNLEVNTEVNTDILVSDDNI